MSKRVDYRSKDVDIALNTISEKRHEDDFKYESLNSFAFIIKGQKDPHYFLDKPCYAALLKDNVKNVTRFIDFSFAKWRVEEQELSVEEYNYISFLVNKSVYRHAFVRKDPTEIASKGAVFFTHFPAQYIVSAAMYIRNVRELPEDVMNNWGVFSKYMDKNAALYLAHTLSLHQGKYCFIGMHLHTCVEKDNIKNAMKNMAKEDFFNFGTELFRNNQDYKYLADIWGEKDIQQFHLKDYKGVKRKEYRDCWGSSSNNYYIPEENIEEFCKDVMEKVVV